MGESTPKLQHAQMTGQQYRPDHSQSDLMPVKTHTNLQDVMSLTTTTHSSKQWNLIKLCFIKLSSQRRS